MELLETKSLSFIKPLSFHISSNAIFGTLSILGLGLFTYLGNRYLNTNKDTSNQYYTKTEETILGTPNLKLTTEKGCSNIIYAFWNGDLSSTYLLIDLLLQDKVIQPLYIERYTILKSLEYDNLAKLTKQYTATLQDNKANKNNINSNGNANSNANSNSNPEKEKDTIKIKKYLEDVARIKKNQANEITQLEIFRKIILKQYPEFQKNLLPTQYITTITKDLQHTSNFFSILKNISPLYYNGIEFLEQVSRFLKYYKPVANTKKSKDVQSRILVGYTKDNKNMELVSKILIEIRNSNTKSILEDVNIEIPLKDINNDDVKYLAVNFFPNDIMKYFKQR